MGVAPRKTYLLAEMIFIKVAPHVSLDFLSISANQDSAPLMAQFIPILRGVKRYPQAVQLKTANL
jgi:hypothetical protein